MRIVAGAVVAGVVMLVLGLLITPSGFVFGVSVPALSLF